MLLTRCVRRLLMKRYTDIVGRETNVHCCVLIKMQQVALSFNRYRVNSGVVFLSCAACMAIVSPAHRVCDFPVYTKMVKEHGVVFKSVFVYVCTCIVILCMLRVWMGVMSVIMPVKSRGV